MDVPEIPILRFGREYTSLDRNEVKGYADGAPRALVSQANAGLLRRDLKKIGEHAAVLHAIPAERLLGMCREAGELFLNGTLPLAEGGPEQSPEDYVEALSATSGMPHALCRGNMRKVHHVLTEMPTILRGLTRALPYDVFDGGLAEVEGLPVSFASTTSSLGVVLPSNSPGVNSIWIPAIAMKTPVVVKPGREEPWTPLRIIRAFIAAGVPAQAFGFYPTDHEGARTILELCGRSQLFGDEKTTAPYASNPAIEIHGPGRSKVLIGEREVDRWEEHLDVLVASIAANGGRSCVNASAVYVPRHADAIADALARRLTDIVPREPADPDAALSAFANPAIARAIDAALEAGVAKDGARDVTAEYRDGPRLREAFGGTYLLPTIVRCPVTTHPLANTEFLFPFASVVEVPAERMLAEIGPSLVVTAITKAGELRDALVRSPLVERLNLGPIPTSHVEWDQPHEGNLFETLYTRRAIQRVPTW